MTKGLYSYPFWPPTSPQDPHNVPGRGVRAMMQDLAVNQIPKGRNTEVQPWASAVPIVRPPEFPTNPEAKSSATVGYDLYSLMMATIETPPEKMVFNG